MQTHTQHTSLSEQILQAGTHIDLLKEEIKKIIIGHDDVINYMIIALLANGHVLLEGVPGVAKTTMVKTITNALGLTFKRIQFTPDLLPTDLIGTLIYNPKTQDFETKKGPIFANLILADEINRAPAKVQSALLEAMQEQQVTIGSSTYTLDKPFLVFATQNPIEQEGTYRLPEAQLDRFMFKVLVEYPTPTQEKAIVQRTHNLETINIALSSDTLFQQQQLVRAVYVDEKIVDYIVSLISAFRTPEQYGMADAKNLITHGPSSRASIALYRASQAEAFLKQRHFVIPEDVKRVAHATLRHRLPVTYEAEAQNIDSDALISMALRKVPCH
jgi:MoxR-like ATPase